jgi:two-component system chemotaxis sensor kinase CheA
VAVGTTINITLPLTLAIIQGLLVGVVEELYVLPLDQVRECVELREGDASPGGGQLLLLRGEVVPYIRLREWFGVEGDKPALEQVVVAVTDSGQRVGLAVDRVVGEQQTVVKGLGRLLGRTEGLTGATVLGDGSLALILDVSRLAGLAGKAGEEVARWTAEG